MITKDIISKCFAAAKMYWATSGTEYLHYIWAKMEAVVPLGDYDIASDVIHMAARRDLTEQQIVDMLKILKFEVED